MDLGPPRKRSSHLWEVSGDDSRFKSPLDDSPFSDRVLGILVLLTVPFAWGTYTPVVRYLYEIKPAVPGFVFSAAYYVVASVALNGILLFRNTEASAEASSSSSSEGLPIQGGAELGTYLFLGNALQIIGLKTVPSDRAGFLVQLTTVMVPLVEALFKGNLFAVSLRTWTACFIAFCGVVVMGLDSESFNLSNGASAAISSFSQGDACIIGAAVVYTLHVVRLGQYAQESQPLNLAAAKASAEALLSSLLVVFLVGFAGMNGTDETGVLGYAKDAGHDISIFVGAIRENGDGGLSLQTLLPGIAATLWTGLVTCAYTIYAQTYGQKRVRPTEANLIYSVQPLCTALFAWILLREQLEATGIVGGIFILVALYLVATETSEKDV